MYIINMISRGDRSVKREGKSMRMQWNKVVLAMVVLMSLMFLAPMEASAGEVTSGTIGDNGGLQWTYDSETQTLVLTGEDSLSAEFETVFTQNWDVVGGPFYDICDKFDRRVLRDCTLVGDCSGAFMGLVDVQYIEFENVDTSQVTDMSEMFFYCNGLTSLDVSSFDTSQVTDMSDMF